MVGGGWGGWEGSGVKKRFGSRLGAVGGNRNGFERDCSLKSRKGEEGSLRDSTESLFLPLQVSYFAAFVTNCHVCCATLADFGRLVGLVLCRYILEGKELEFYIKKLQKKKGGKTAA